MSIETLTTFFMWCTIINAGILLFWGLFMIVAPDFVYRTQSKWFSISRESFDLVMYSFLALFKALFVVFFLVPWLALLIMA
jgi:hypothetical protein